jgi:hypothetical protein
MIRLPNRRGFFIHSFGKDLITTLIAALAVEQDDGASFRQPVRRQQAAAAKGRSPWPMR